MHLDDIRMCEEIRIANYDNNSLLLRQGFQVHHFKRPKREGVHLARS